MAVLTPTPLHVSAGSTHEVELIDTASGKPLDLTILIRYDIPKKARAKDRVWITVKPTDKKDPTRRKWMHTAAIQTLKVIHMHFEEDKKGSI